MILIKKTLPLNPSHFRAVRCWVDILSSKFITRILLVLVVIFSVSCASKVRTNITTFTNEKASFSTGTIGIVNASSGQGNNGLEFEFYKNKLASKLESIGYQVVDEQAPEFLAFLDYGVARREKESDNSHVQFGLGFGRYSRFGRVIFSEPLTREFEFVRRVHLAIEKNLGQGSRSSESADDKLIELDAVSLGRCAQLIEVFDPMLEAIFENLYRPNGSTERVTVPGGDLCK